MLSGQSLAADLHLTTTGAKSTQPAGAPGAPDTGGSPRRRPINLAASSLPSPSAGGILSPLSHGRPERHIRDRTGGQPR
jgi:hypothetical protein